MKDFLTKYFGILGLAVYYALAIVIRIPVYCILLLVISMLLLIVAPITGKDCNYHWVNRLYDWYCGK